MAQRHVETGTASGDFDIGRNNGLAAADRSAHRLSQHGVNAGAAVLVLSVEADNRALAVRNRGVRQQLDQIGCACVRP